MLRSAVPLLLALALGAADDGPDIRAGLVESTRLDDGSRRTSALLLWHRTTAPDGTVSSSHLLNWVQAGDHRMLVPLWFGGPGYDLVPPALSGSWTRDDGGRSTWITPLFHADRDEQGRLEDLHLLTWMQGRDHELLLPLYYREGPRRGVVPLWFAGAGWWTVPAALSGSFSRLDGGRSTWITPLFHLDRDNQGRIEGMHLGPYQQGGGVAALYPLYGRWSTADGGASTWLTPLFHYGSDASGRTTSWHALNWIHSPGRDVVLPLAWLEHGAGGTTGTVVPLWAAGQDWWAVPPLLTAAWTNREGGRSTWITPLFHVDRNLAGRRTGMHALNWISDDDGEMLLPFYYRRGDSLGVLPLWLQDDDGWTAPPLLSWHRRSPGGSSTWLTPLAHLDRKPDGTVSSLHALNWYQQGERRGLVPLWFDGPGWWTAPPLLSGGWTRADGGSSTWITPLFHQDRAADGTVASLHAGPWFQGRDWRMLVPLAWQGPGGWAVPPLLSWSRRSDDGGSSTWLTPLFHLDRDADGRMTGMHALNWISGADGEMLLPFYYRRGDSLGVLPFWLQNAEGWTAPPLLSWHRRSADGGDTTWITPLAHVSREVDGTVSSLHALNWYQQDGRRGLVPLWFDGPDWWTAPPLLSGGWTRADGGSSTWITPLFHVDRDATGRRTGMHALNWISDDDGEMLLPLYYRRGASLGVLPFWLQNADGWTAPPLLSWRRRSADGGDTTWITPLTHVSRGPDGVVSGLHALNWYQQDGRRGLVPLWFDGPGWWTAPPLLSGGWTRADGGRSTWLTPLYHEDRDAAGNLDARHALTWWQDQAGSGLLPLWWHGDGATLVPPLLTASWRRENGGRATWITPLFHVGSDAAGRTTDWHALTVSRFGDTTVVAPFGWVSGPPEARSRVLVPFLYQGPNHLVVAPLWYDVRADSGRHRGLVPLWYEGPGWWTAPLALAGGWSEGGRSTSMITPLYHRSSEDGRTTSMHLLTWVRTPGFEAVAPLWWDWRTAASRQRLLAPLWWQREGLDGAYASSVLPLGFNYRSGAAVDDSLATQLWPFRVQNATDGHELAVLWRLFKLRERQSTTEVEVWPLWWSDHRAGEPMGWQIFGGLFGRDVDRTTHTTLDYAAWDALRFGPRTSYGIP